MSSWQGRKSGRWPGRHDYRRDGAGCGKVPAELGGRGSRAYPDAVRPRVASCTSNRLAPEPSGVIRDQFKGRTAVSWLPAAALGPPGSSVLRDIPRLDPRVLSHSVGRRQRTIAECFCKAGGAGRAGRRGFATMVSRPRLWGRARQCAEQLRVPGCGADGVSRLAAGRR
jgi:hypothetical protein